MSTLRSYPETVDDIQDVIFIPKAYNAYEPSTGRMFITYGKTRRICGEILSEERITEIKRMWSKFFT